MRLDHSIAMLCDLLLVSSSGFYDWDRRRRTPRPRAQKDQALVERITRIHAESRQTYGSPRIVDELRARGQRHGRNRIARLMKSMGLCGRQKGRYRVQTTDSNHANPSPPITWRRLHSPQRQTRSGSPISPTSIPARAGCSSPESWICTAANSLVGP